MILKELHIYNYGSLSNYHMSFNDSLNTIKNDNGSGKTTIASFIRSMLYGIVDNGKSIQTSTRMHYAPWDGGRFGGYLDIIHNNKKYRIERIFSPTSSNDSFKLIDLDTNKETSDYDSNIGNAILGINADSFERTLFIPQETQNKNYTPNDSFSLDVKSKLIEIIGGNIDNDSFEEAINRLNEANKVLFKSKDSKYKVTRDLYTNILDRINECKSNINAIGIIDDNSNDLKNKIDSLNKRKLELEAIENNHYKLASLRAEANLINNYKTRIAKMDYDLTNKKAKLNNISPDDINISLVKRNVEEYNRLNIELNNEDIIATNRELERLDDYSFIDSNKIEAIENHVKEYYDSVNKKSNNVGGIIITIIATILALFGVLGFNYNKNISFLLFGSGIVLYITALIMLLSSNRKLNSNKNKLIEIELKEFFSKFGFYSNEYNSYLYNIKGNLLYRDSLLEKLSSINKTVDKYKENMRVIKLELDRFFNRFILESNDYYDKLNELNNIIRDINDLTFEYKRIIAEFEKYKKDNNINEDIKVDEGYNFDDILLEHKQIDIELLELNNRLNTLSNNIFKITDLKRELEDLIEEKKTCEALLDEINHKHKIIELAISELTKAHDRLLNRFIKPIGDNIGKYIHYFSNDDYVIDSDFNFIKVYNGEYKDSKFLSKGLQDSIGFIMRLALIDTIYNTEGFIILDDPFVNYDEERLDSAKKLILELSQRYQIIYLTCHDSRKIEV